MVPASPTVDPTGAGSRLARATVLLVLAATVGVTLLLLARTPAGAQDDLVAEGRALYLVGCVSCHGADGEGVVPTAATRGDRRW